MHTPAPWLLSDARSTKVNLINTAKGHAIGEIVWVDARNPADAKLISAAPELLEALNLLIGTVEQHCMSDDPDVKKELEQARAAINKAI